MASIFNISKQPRVFNSLVVAKLADANCVARQLRGIGCRVLSLSIGEPGEYSELVVDRNPHVVIRGFSSVHVTWSAK